MKRLFTLLIFALLGIDALQAQWHESRSGMIKDDTQPYFAKDGMEWNVMNKAASQLPFNYNTTTFATLGDTTINGTDYVKLYSKESSNVTPTGQPCSTNWVFRGAMREETGGKVFYIPMNGQECLIYDFGMEEGDTATMYWLQTVSDANRVRIRVDSITTIEKGGASRKCMYISSTCLGQNGEKFNWMAYNCWVEGIGDILHGPIYTCQATNVGGIVTQTLLCCQNDGMQIYNNDEYESCIEDNVAYDYKPLVASDKLWYVITSDCWFPPEPQTRLTRIYKISDEEIEIEGLVYKKIYATSKEDLTNWYYAGVIYETPDKKVYAKDAAFSYEDYPFYDFSLSEGDTFPVDPYIGLYLERLSDTTINGETRKKFTFQYLEYGNPVNGYKEIWVEGIGSELGLLERGTRFYDCEYTELLCSYENGIKVWDKPYNGHCFFTTDGMEESQSENRIYAYPNPTDNIVTIYGTSVDYVQIYNTLGQCIKTVRGTNIINMQTLPDGIYCMHIASIDGKQNFIKIKLKK